MCLQELTPLMLHAQNSHRGRWIGRQPESLGYNCRRQSCRVRGISQNTVHSFFCSYLINSIYIGRANIIIFVRFVLSWIIREIIAKNGIIAQIFRFLYCYDLLR